MYLILRGQYDSILRAQYDPILKGQYDPTLRVQHDPTLTLYGIGLRNRGVTFPRPVGCTSKYKLKVKYSIKVSSSFESPALDLEAPARFL